MSDTPAETWIEAFHTGKPAAVRAGIDERVIDEVIANYRPDEHHAPLVFGHPESDEPARGLITALRRDGHKLFVKASNIAKEAVDGVRDGSFLKPSAAFWHPSHPSNPTPGKWNFRHQALLGSASPGIQGLPRLAFDADDAITCDDPAPAFVSKDPTTDAIAAAVSEAVIEGIAIAATAFAAHKESAVAEPTETPSAVTAEQFAALQAELNAEKAARAAERKAQFKAGNAAFIADLVRQGKVTPAEAPVFCAVLNTAPDEDYAFAADDKQPVASKLKTVLASRAPVVPFGKMTPTGSPEFDASDPAAQADAAWRKSVGSLNDGRKAA